MAIDGSTKTKFLNKAEMSSADGMEKMVQVILTDNHALLTKRAYTTLKGKLNEAGRKCTATKIRPGTTYFEQSRWDKDGETAIVVDYGVPLYVNDRGKQRLGKRISLLI